jgi:hypothetical protein
MGVGSGPCPGAEVAEGKERDRRYGTIESPETQGRVQNSGHAGVQGTYGSRSADGRGGHRMVVTIQGGLRVPVHHQ